jgi:hypothetical protein
MINATEARQIARDSDAEVKTILEKIGEKIEKAARNGEYFLNISTEFASWDRLQIKQFKPQQELTDFQKKLKTKLVDLGYSFEMKPYTYKVGGGLGCIDPEDYSDEVETGYHLTIRW